MRIQFKFVFVKLCNKCIKCAGKYNDLKLMTKNPLNYASRKL